MSSAGPRLVDGLLRLYPAGWRARYADEFTAVLAAAMAEPGPRRRWRRWRMALDVAAGAADAHLHPAGGPARADRVRNSACVAFGAFAVFCLAGSGFQKMSEDPAFFAAGRAHAAIGWSYDVVLYGAIVAAVTVVAGSLPVLLGIVRQAAAGRRDLRLRLLVPPVGAAAWVGFVLGVSRLHQAGGVQSTANVVAFAGVALLGVLVAGASAAALVSATRRADLPAAGKQAQWVPMIGLSAAMMAVTAADLVWGLSLPRTLYHSHNGVLATSLPATWISTLAVMAAASAVAGAATVRATRLGRGGPTEADGLPA